ncbi:MAG: acyltransferase [Chitinophagaceae bacterium]|nr:MAG: acyltransferase [Chitinophagaceae bacterium]
MNRTIKWKAGLGMLGYRAEIDGLRAIAVAGVLLFHANFTFIPGGFVGVDVFFVISGYLITSIILREMELGKFSFVNFYERRAKRLLPPLLPVLLVSILFSFATLDAESFGGFTRSLYSAVGFVSNWYFLQSVSYFGGPGEQTPLLHLWSLSIEEQFYFLFPAALFVLFRLNRTAVYPAVIFLLAFSAAYSFYFVLNYNFDDAFYNSFARFWELLVGAVLAVKPNWRTTSKASANTAEILGMCMIAGAMLKYTSATPFPGPSAIIPVIGAALIICARGTGSIVSPILKSKPFVALGLISYALYLWHWPILVFTKLLVPGIGDVGMMLALCCAIALAKASYLLIEQPVRTKTGFRAPHVAMASGLSIVFVVGVAAVVSSDRISKFQERTFTDVRKALYSGNRADMIARIEDEGKRYLGTLNVNFNAVSGEYLPEKYKGWTCSYDLGNTIDRLYECLVSQAGDENVLVMGDSIGRDTTHALRRAFPKTNFIMLHQSSCPPGEAKSCFKDLAELLAKLSASIKIKAVVLNFRYRPSEWGAVASGIEVAKKLTPNVILFGVSPAFKMSPVELIKSIPPSSDVPLFLDQGSPKFVQLDYSGLVGGARQMALSHNIYFVNILDFFCPQKKCRVWVDNRYGDPLLFDREHLTNNGISEFAEYLKRQPAIISNI